MLHCGVRLGRRFWKAIKVSAIPPTRLVTNETVWQPDRTAKPAPWPMPSMPQALRYGLRGLCPSCGKGHIFNGYLRVVENCSACGAPLGRIRADDVPPYATILITGHIVVPLMLWLEASEHPPLWVHTIIWVPLTVALVLGLLRPLKGAIIGLMLKLGLVRPESDE
jgi:uncharacterized protein (DUF983 family)